jgi:non-specific serine/threonine protein kinase
VQEDTVSVVELVTAFRIGKLDLHALLDALAQRQSLAEDDYRTGVDTLWKMREEGAIDEVTVSTLLERLQGLRAKAPSVAADDVTVVKPTRNPLPDEDITRVLPSSDAPVSDGEGRTGSSHSHASSLGSWAQVAAASGQHVTVGSTLKGRFLLERELGRGGMGVVYLAQDARKVEARDRDPWLAVKVLSDEFRRHPDSLIALQREARRSQQLAHDNIVRVYDFDKDEGIVFMTMEYVEGNDLRTLIREQAANGMPLARARPLIEGMARALARAHAAGIVHSDFKPGNVMVTTDGVAKVFDFGIARAGQHKADVSGEQTVFDAATLGALTPAYASLEMLRGQAPTPADDIYALGCVCFELLGGRHPFDKLSAEVALKEGRKPPPLPGLSKRQYRTLCAAVAFDAKQRLPDVQALLDGLREVSWRERALPVVGYGTAAALVLGVAGTLVWRQAQSSHLAEVIGRFNLDAADRYRDEAQAWEGLGSLGDDQRARVVVERSDTIEKFLQARLDELWKPSAGRFNYPGTAAVFALRDRLRLYAPALDKRHDQLEDERDVQLNTLDTRLADGLAQADLFGAGANSMQETLTRIRAIDPGSPLLRNTDLEVGYADAIAAALQAGDLSVAKQRLALAQQQFPDSLRLQMLAAQSRVQARPSAVVAAAGDAAQSRARVEALLREAPTSAGWQEQMHAALASLRSAPDFAQLQERVGQSIATALAGHDQAAQLPDDLVLLSFGLEQAPQSAPLQAQRERLQQRQQAMMASLESERAQAGLVARSESLRRAVAAGDLDKAERLLLNLRKDQPEAAFVREQAPALLEQAYQGNAATQFAKGNFSAAASGLERATRVLGDRPSLRQALDRYQLIAAVMAVTDSTPAAERERLRQRLETGYRNDATALTRLEREMQVRGQLPQGSLRARLQRDVREAAPATVAASAAPAAATAAAKPAARPVAPAVLPGASAEEEPLPPVPDGPDPCEGLAGRARGCFDPVAGGRGPMMMVIPAMSGGKAYALSRGEIAVDDFNAYCRATGRCSVQNVSGAEQGRLPAQNITLAQARGYARWLTRASGGWRYRLPTDAEWLHAAQADRQWRQAPDSNCIPPTATGEHVGAPAGVRGREANPWGLVNLSGNVWEWVSNGEAGALRGGSYTSFWSDCSVQARRNASGAAQADVGLRILRELK